MKKENILDMELKETSLTVRTRNCLLASQIYTFKDLLDKSYTYFWKIDGIGAKSVAEIIEMVNSHGYTVENQDFFYKKKASLPWVKKLIEEAVAKEREACAKVCDNKQYVHPYHDLGTLIRARGEA
jgi:hypothetical protein